jgi:hypothetical protein
MPEQILTIDPLPQPNLAPRLVSQMRRTPQDPFHAVASETINAVCGVSTDARNVMAKLTARFLG